MRYRQLVYIVLVLVVAAIPFVVAACAPAPTPQPITIVQPTVVDQPGGIKIDQSQIMMDSGIEDMTIFDDKSHGVACYIFDDKMDCVKY
jgi:hypothetical protein